MGPSLLALEEKGCRGWREGADGEDARRRQKQGGGNRGRGRGHESEAAADGEDGLRRRRAERMAGRRGGWSTAT